MKVHDEKQKFSMVKKDGDKYASFICDCGHKMFDNTSKKKNGQISQKAPDVVCMARENCSLGKQNGDYFNANAGYITKEMREKMSTKKAKTNQSYERETDSYSNSGIMVSMYAKWAHEQAMFLAKENGVTEHDVLNDYFSTCLENMKNTLNRHVGVNGSPKKSVGIPKNNEPVIEEEETKEVSMDSFNIDLDDLDVFGA